MEKRNELQRLERAVRTYMVLSRENVKMLHYMTRDVPDPFLCPELIDRVSLMLNYFLVKLAGDQKDRLRVSPIFLSPTLTCLR